MGIIDKLKDFIKDIKDEGEVLKGDKSKDTHFSSQKEFADEFEAIESFQISKEKLFNVDDWSNIPAVGSSSFKLYSREGNPSSSKKPIVGDYIKIDLAGLLPDNWVEVIDVKEDGNFAEFTVKPSADPTKNKESSTTEHFFQKQARSTFRVQRRGTLIYAEEVGRNETINNEDEEAGNRKIVNTVISEGGWAGFQKYQWKTLTDYLVDKD